MSINKILGVTLLNELTIKRINEAFYKRDLITGRDMLKLVARIAVLNGEIAYARDTVYTRLDVDSNLFGSGLGYVYAEITSKNGKLKYAFTVNCEPSEMKQALRLVDSIARACYHSTQLLGTSFANVGGKLELECGSLRELRCTYNRISNSVQYFIGHGGYIG
jgi:hypothetical protein